MQKRTVMKQTIGLKQLSQYHDDINIAQTVDQLRAQRLDQIVTQIAELMKTFYSDDFDLDGTIERKRSTESEGKRSRSNSIDKEVTAEVKIQNKYKNYELSQVEERS